MYKELLKLNAKGREGVGVLLICAAVRGRVTLCGRYVW